MTPAEGAHWAMHVVGGLAVGRLVALWFRERVDRKLAAAEAALRLGAPLERRRRWRDRSPIVAWLDRVYFQRPLGDILFFSLLIVAFAGFTRLLMEDWELAKQVPQEPPRLQYRDFGP